MYVAGPYSTSPQEGTDRAFRVAQVLIAMGYAPVVPHAFHYLPNPGLVPYDTIMAVDFSLLSACHHMVLIPGESPGAEQEERLAVALGIPVARIRPGSWGSEADLRVALRQVLPTL